MGHYAKVKDGKVERVIAASADFFDSFVDDTPGDWIKTSYNTRGGVHYDPETGEPSSDQTKALRKNFAGVGYVYDVTKDAFYSQKPFPSWTLNETSCTWEPPVDYPADFNTVPYVWNEETQAWDAVE
jgi:hypothetical protein